MTTKISFNNLKVDYSKPTVSPDYYCHQCKRTNCKLWRDYQTSLQSQELLCATCAMEQQKKSGEVDSEGYRQDKYGITDQIGAKVPAVPCEDIDTFWGYTSVPEPGVKWWRSVAT